MLFTFEIYYMTKFYSNCYKLFSKKSALLSFQIRMTRETSILSHLKKNFFRNEVYIFFVF